MAIGSIPRLLLIEDSARFARALISAAANRYEIVAVQSAEEGLARLPVERYDAILLDLHLKPGHMNGFEFLEVASREHPAVPVLILSSEEKADVVIPAMEKGACGYAPKSLTFPEIFERIDACSERHQLLCRAEDLEEQIRADRPFLTLDHPLMQTVEAQMRQVAPHDATVMLLGETGTGKTVMAREIHALSPRHQAPFVRFDCSAHEPQMVGSALFGSVCGAFTGAVNRPGRAEAAHQGTLFIDELNHLDRQAQGNLLGLIEERRVSRIGATSSSHIDVRIICASSQDLRIATDEGRFLPELLNRLEVFPIRIPPLRDMRAIIPYLTDFYVARFARQMHKRITSVAPATLEILKRAAWRGNIRELRNFLESAVIRCEGQRILPTHLPLELQARGEDAALSFQDSVEQAKDQKRRELMLEALSANAWNIPAAARGLEITPQALRQAMDRLEIARTKHGQGRQ